MNPQLVKHLGMKLEAASISLLLLYYLGMTGLPEGPINAASYGILAILITWRWKRFIYVATRDIPLLLLLVTAVASIFWSAAPAFTINEMKTLLRAMFLGVYLATRYRIEDLVRIFLWVFGIAVILSLLTALALPAYGTHGGGWSSPWKGIFGYKNALACVATIAAMLFLLTAITRRRQRWVALGGFGIAAALVLFSQSKSGLSVFLILLFLWPLYKLVKQHYKLRVVLLLIAILLGGIVAILLLSNLETIVVDGLGKDLEFNGRIPIWNIIIEKGLERPWLGYGYVGFWTSDAGLFIVYHSWASEGHGDVTARFNSHNAFIDLFVQLGWVGLSLYLLNLMILFFKVISLLFITKKIEFFWIIQFILSMILYSLSDSVMGTILTPSSFWTIYVSIALSVALEQKRILKKNFFEKRFHQSRFRLLKLVKNRENIIC
ncbi:O-antigen ligase family protein [Allocoleopsis sp.]|uniref:O-antigen ligase family protein n=1 Tax=Allocoleopsis sp. TaxID=3088169 RepID=UPI002FD52465